MKNTERGVCGTQRAELVHTHTQYAAAELACLSAFLLRCFPPSIPPTVRRAAPCERYWTLPREGRSRGNGAPRWVEAGCSRRRGAVRGLLADDKGEGAAVDVEFVVLVV